MLREMGIDAESVFDHPEIKVWRSIPERENCTLDADLSDGRHVRLHIKRYHPARGITTPADDEAQAIRAMEIEKIPTVPLVGWGKLIDGRSFLITEDLAGYHDAEKAIRTGLSFEKVLEPTADLTAKLHGSGLHHRDLYLCHFFVNAADSTDLRLIGFDDTRLASLAIMIGSENLSLSWTRSGSMIPARWRSPTTMGRTMRGRHGCWKCWPGTR